MKGGNIMIFLFSTITDETIRFEVAELYEKYSRFCYIEAYRITHDEQQSKDVVQTVFERLIIYLDSHTLNNITNPRGFLVVIANREAINLIKKHTYKSEILTDSINDYRISLENKPLMNVLKLDQAGRFLKKLDRMKPEYAKIIALKYARDFSDEEISQLLGISTPNVRMRLTRARRAYEKLLKRGDDDE